MKLIEWITTLFSGRPHFYIGGQENPYLLRWYLIPRNRWLNLYLHKFMRDDDDRALHDHPWWFVSVMLWGGYVETRPARPSEPGAYYKRREGWFCDCPRGWLSVVFRRATDRHRVSLDRGHCWTLVLTGPKVREWGFWCPKGFVVWTDFVAQDDHGNIGKGCE
jgi:hypothetical protein